MANEPQVFAIKGADEEEWVEKTFKSFQQGIGRFGWSGIEEGDLYRLKTKIESQGWDALSPDEQSCWNPILFRAETGRLGRICERSGLRQVYSCSGNGALLLGFRRRRFQPSLFRGTQYGPRF